MLRRIKTVINSWIVITILTISICYLTESVAARLGIKLPQQLNVTQVRELFIHAFENSKYFWSAVLNGALILILLPVVEELVFRGLFFRLPAWLCSGRKSDYHSIGFSNLLTVFAVVSSILFSAAHYVQQPFPDNAFLALFFFGFAQCWLYRRTGRIWCPMLNHSLFNLTNLVLMLVFKEI